MATSAEVDLKCISQRAAAAMDYPELKGQQLEAMVVFMSRKDVFIVLPIGFGKSLIYAALPMAYNALLATNVSTVLVVSLLTAIMKDQVVWYSLYTRIGNHNLLTSTIRFTAS